MNKVIPRPLMVYVRVDETGDIPIQETAADNWFGMKQTDSGHKMGCRWEGGKCWLGNVTLSLTLVHMITSDPEPLVR